MKEVLLFVMTLLFLIGCTSNEIVYNPECLELDKKLAHLKNEKKFNTTVSLT